MVVSAAFIACYHCNHVDRGNTKSARDCIATNQQQKCVLLKSVSSTQCVQGSCNEAESCSFRRIPLEGAAISNACSILFYSIEKKNVLNIVMPEVWYSLGFSCLLQKKIISRSKITTKYIESIQEKLPVWDFDLTP